MFKVKLSNYGLLQGKDGGSIKMKHSTLTCSLLTIRVQVSRCYEYLSGHVKCIKILFLSLHFKLKSNRYIRLEITFLCINLFRVPGILVCT